MTNCYNLLNFINNFKNKNNKYFLIYSDELYLLNKIKNIVKCIFSKMNFTIKFIFDDVNFHDNIKSLILSNILKQNELILIEIHQFKFIYFNLIKKIFNYDNYFKKFLIILFKINKNIEKNNYFKFFINKFWFLKIYNLNKNQLKNIIKVKLNILNKKFINLLLIFLLKKINNNILLIQEIYKLKIYFYKKKLIFKKLNKFISDNYYISYNNILIDFLNFNFQKVYKILYFYKKNLDYLIIINNIFINFINNLMLNKNYLNFKIKLFSKIENLKLKKFLIYFKNLSFEFKTNMFYNDMYLINKNWLILINILIKLISYFIKLKKHKI